MYRKLFLLSVVSVLAFVLGSCLTCEKKEYIFQLTGPDSGKLTIRYINIFSNSIDSAGEIESDYRELIDMWLAGEKIERDFPKATKIKKRLFQQEGKLCGEVVMEFNSLPAVRLFRFHKQGPYMFSLNAFPDDGENFQSGNGEFGGEHMPVVFWPSDMQNLRFTTYIAKPDSSCVSLLERWRKDKSQQ